MAVPRLRFFIKRGGSVFALEHAPIEWDESSLRWQRSDLYKGLTRDFSLPFEFVKDGAKILRAAYYLEGVEAEAELIVEAYRGLATAYVEVYRGEFDFSGFKDREDSVICPLADKGVESMIKARENVTYELDLSKSLTSVEIPKIAPTKRGFSTPFSIASGWRLVVPAVIAGSANFPLGTVQFNSASSGEFGPESEMVALSNNAHFFQSVGSEIVHFSFRLSIGNVNFYRGSAVYQLKIIDSDLHLYSNPVITGAGVLDFNLTIYTQPGKRYFMYFERMTSDLAARDLLSPTINADLSNIEASYTEEVTSHVVKAFRASEVFGQLIYLMTDFAPGVTRSKSSLLERSRNLFITSGEGIRGLEDAKLKTSFKDFFQSMKSVLGACFGVEDGVAVLENYAYFYNKTLTAYNVGEVTEAEISTAENYMFSRVAVGYKNQDYDVSLGREEFNTEQEYSTPLTRQENSLDLISPYRADHFGIDKARLEGEASNVDRTDSKTDNDVFMVYSNGQTSAPGVYVAQTSGEFQEVFGLSGRPNVINLALSPKRNLLRHGDFLSGSVSPALGLFKFETSAKDVELVSKINDETIIERANLFTGSLPPPLFLPVIANVTTPIGVEALQQLKTRNTGVISFRFRGATFRGFILGAEANLSRSAEVNLELLLSPDSDLSKLID